MFKALLKKQLLELNRGFFMNRKTGKARTRAAALASILFFCGLIVVVMGGIFFFLSLQLRPLIQLGLGWLYFAILGLVSIVLGTFGSVFNTYASLYDAKDNDLLLSMPIPPRCIVLVRLSGVYLLGLMYSAVVFLPAQIVYLMTAKPAPATVALMLLFGLSVSLIVLILSCLLGWVVAQIARRLKNRSLLTVLASLLFMALYYVCYFRASNLLTALLADSEAIAAGIRGSVWPLYAFGLAGTGQPSASVGLAAVCLVLTGLVGLLLSRTFFSLATGTGKARKTSTRGWNVRVRTPASALLAREMRRFVSSPVYMLNCSMGTLFLLIAGVAVLTQSALLRQLGTIFTEPSVFAMILVGLLCTLVCLNDITAPSISLEGETLWLIQSLPVAPWHVLLAKLRLHLLLTCPPALVCSVCVIIAMRVSVLVAVCLIVLPQLFIVMNAAFGLAVNLKLPNLHWTSESAVVKQGANVFLALFGGWIYLAALVGLYLLVHSVLSPLCFLLAATGLSALLTVLLYGWLKRRGTQIFASL